MSKRSEGTRWKTVQAKHSRSRVDISARASGDVRRSGIDRLSDRNCRFRFMPAMFSVVRKISLLPCPQPCCWERTSTGISTHEVDRFDARAIRWCSNTSLNSSHLSVALMLGVVTHSKLCVLPLIRFSLAQSRMAAFAHSLGPAHGLIKLISLVSLTCVKPHPVHMG